MTVAAAYRSKLHKPDDFDAFWDDVLRQASAIPLDAEVVPDPLRTSEDVEVFQVFYTSLEHVRIAGWYCRPARRPERMPAIMLLPGYQMDPPIPKEWARKGYIALSVAPRGTGARNEKARRPLDDDSRSSSRSIGRPSGVSGARCPGLDVDQGPIGGKAHVK
jgi:cephalosporin-C deacetylase